MIEAIIVSFGCLDLLSISLPANINELDNVIIVTKPNDKETIEYCKSRNYKDKIDIFETDSFNFDGAAFNKGLAISLAMNRLKYKDWIITLDTDIILPKDFKNNFLNLNPDIEYFYGMRRINLDTREDLLDLVSNKKKPEDFICYRGSGYGYFSCVNYKSKTQQELLRRWNGMGYPFWIKEAREIDWLWRNNWGERILDPQFKNFPEDHFVENSDYDTGLYKELPFRCLHLGIAGKNHEIRTTKIF